MLDNECTMNRSILLSTFALACLTAPMMASLAQQAPAPGGAPAAAPRERPRADTPHGNARHLSPEERSKLREHVRMASQEREGATPVSVYVSHEEKKDKKRQQ